MVLRMTNLLLILQRQHCSSLIFICTNKIVVNIWILYYTILFVHISILYNFISLIIFFFLIILYNFILIILYNVILKNIFQILQEKLLMAQSVGIFREMKKMYYICNNHWRNNSVSDLPMGIPTNTICLYVPESWKKFNAYAIISNGHMPTE
jgi:hypothetical protein